MQFSLPSNLQAELLAYDPVTRPLAKAKATANAKDKPKFPLGKVADLIPEDVVSKDKFDKAVEFINGQPLGNRCARFTSVKEGVEKLIAILYHYESVWYAAWLPPAAKKDEYICGYALAFRHNKSTVNKIYPYQLDNTVGVTFGKSNFLVRKQLFTIDAVKEHFNSRRGGYGNLPWQPTNLNSYSDKSKVLHSVVKRFNDTLAQTIPTWEDGYLLERVSNNRMFDVFINRDIPDVDRNTWQPTVKWVIENGLGVGFRSDAIKHIVDTPVMRKWIQQQLDEAIGLFNNVEVKSKRDVQRPYNVVIRLLSRIDWVHSIWPDCPLDYYQNNLKLLLHADAFPGVNPRANAWFRAHMPVASFFSILNKLFEKTSKPFETLFNINNATGLHTYSTRELYDTFMMVRQILDADKELAPPKRWRLTEFHDYVMAEGWKIKNKNTALPQDLFPNPIKVKQGDHTITFIQPIDTHQLAQWGQAVRNCVGSTDTYAKKVKAKEHFIVLAMIDGKPTFTVQLKLSMGVFNVEQIVSIANRRLTDEEQALYEAAFGAALQQRNAELGSTT